MTASRSQWQLFISGIILAVGAFNAVGLALVLEALGHSFADGMGTIAVALASVSLTFLGLHFYRNLRPFGSRILARYWGADTA